MRVLKASENSERSRKAVVLLLIAVLMVFAFSTRPAPVQGQRWPPIPISAERFQEEEWRFYQAGEIFQGSTVLAGTVDNEGHKWFGTDVGLTEFDGHSWRDYDPEPGGAYYSSIAVDAAGHVWTAACDKYGYGGWGPLIEFDGHHWEAYGNEDGLTHCIADIAVDREGHMWFAGEGVVELDGVAWRTYVQDDGLVNRIVYDIFVDEANNKWFGTYDGLSKFDGQTWTTYSIGDASRDYIVAVVVDTAGHIWTGSRHTGVNEFDGTTWHHHTTDNGLVSNEVRSIAIDRQDHLWVGTAGGVSEFDGHTWRNYTTVDGVELAWVYRIFADLEGHLWFCTGSGVAELIRPDATPPGPTPTPIPGEGKISYVGEDGNLWLMNSDGSEQRQLTHTSLGIIGYDWAPDGRRIAFAQLKEGAQGWQPTEIYLLDVESREQELLLSTAEYWRYGAIAWSPLGDQISFVTVPESTQYLVVKTIGPSARDPVEVFRQEFSPMGAAFPPNVNAVNWSPDGEYLAVDLGPDGAFVLSLRETPSVALRASDLGLHKLTDPSFAPTSQAIAWLEWAPSGADGNETLVITSVSGVPRARFPVVGCTDLPHASLAWSPDGERVALAGRGGLCGVDTQSGEVIALVSGEGAWNPSWSADGERIAFSYMEPLEPWGYEEQTIGMVDLGEGVVTDLGVQGTMPAWRPTIPAISRPEIDDLLARKQASIAQLEQTSVDFVGLGALSSVSVPAYDEAEAKALLRDIQSEAESNSLAQEQANAFARLTLQEEALADLLPLYSQASADTSEAGTDIVSILLFSNNEADRVLQACVASDSPLSEACRPLRRLIARQIFRIIDSLGQAIIYSIDDPQQREVINRYWSLVVDEVGRELDTGKELEEILLDTALKGLATRFLVQDYVEAVQPSLDQGVRSADLAYTGPEPVWVVEGQLEHSSLHAEGIVGQATVKAEHAHSTHEHLMRGADIAELIEGVADLGKLSPWAALAKIVEIAMQVERTLIDLTAIAVSADSMNCTCYLSGRAGPLVFNPNQPVEGCRDINAGLSVSPRMARASNRGGDRLAWHLAQTRVERDVESYEEAVEDLIAALSAGDSEAINRALGALDEADQALDSSTGQSVIIIFDSDVPDSQAMSVLSQANQFRFDALSLYLSVASYVTAPEDEREIADIEESASIAVASLDEYNTTLLDAAPTGVERKPLPAIEAVILPDDVIAGDSFNVIVAVRNVGSADASRVAVRAQAAGLAVQSAEIGELGANQIQTTTVQVQAPQTGTLTLLVEVAMDDSVTDSRINQVRVSESPEGAGIWPECCTGLWGIAVLPVLVIVAIRRLRWRIDRCFDDGSLSGGT